MEVTKETPDTKKTDVDTKATTQEQLSLDPETEKLKADLAKVRKENERLAKLAEDMRLKKLKESEDKEAYIRELEERAEKAEKERTAYGTAYMEERKLEAIKFEARKAGLVTEFEDMLERYGTDGVEIETTSSGRVNVIGASSFVSRLKSKYPRMFEQKGSKINSESPTIAKESELTYEKLNELKKKAEKSGNSKSAEWAAYKEALLKFTAS